MSAGKELKTASFLEGLAWEDCSRGLHGMLTLYNRRSAKQSRKRTLIIQMLW
jgi:hypothetical protein